MTWMPELRLLPDRACDIDIDDALLIRASTRDATPNVRFFTVSRRRVVTECDDVIITEERIAESLTSRPMIV